MIPESAVVPVSIRSRLFSREIQHTPARKMANKGFQSAPGFLAGRYPHGPGLDRARADVSIRSRLFSREIRNHRGIGRRTIWFQSAPGFLAGRYMRAEDTSSMRACFNPLPAF